jgi:hypothetical protein
MNATERLKVIHNIIARVGIDGDIPTEMGKAMSMLNGFDSYQAMQPPPMPEITPTDSAGGIISQEPTQGMPPDQSGLNQPPMM